MLPKSEITRVEYCWINQWSSEPKSGIDRQKCQNYSRPFPAQVRPPPKCGWVRAGIPPKKSRSDSDFRNYLPRYIWWYWWWMMGVAPDVAYAEKNVLYKHHIDVAWKGTTYRKKALGDQYDCIQLVWWTDDQPKMSTLSWLIMNYRFIIL